MLVRDLRDRIEELEGERDALRLAITGGEDAPGHNASLPHETILQVLRDNYATARRDAEMAWDGNTAQSWKALAEEAREALRPFAEAEYVGGGWEAMGPVYVARTEQKITPADFRRARACLSALGKVGGPND